MAGIYKLLKFRDGVVRTLSGKIVTVKGVSFKMQKVSGGDFLAGGNQDAQSGLETQAQNLPKLSVRDFYIGQTSVTQRLWVAVMGYNPSVCRYSGDHPVESVSKVEALKFISRLNRLTSLEFRLPSEIEWEFAARGGKKSKGYEFSGSNAAGKVAWYDNNSEEKTHKVAQKKANELKLYDMSGNVSEWCGEICEAFGFSEASNGGAGEEKGIGVLRGGNYNSRKPDVRVSSREFFPQDAVMDLHGFRLAL